MVLAILNLNYDIFEKQKKCRASNYSEENFGKIKRLNKNLVDECQLVSAFCSFSKTLRFFHVT